MSKHDVKTASLIRKSRIRKNIIRLTAVLVIFAAIVTGVFMVAGSAVRTDASDTRIGTKYYRSIVINYGDTLWSLADEYMDPAVYSGHKEYIDEVKKINNLKSDRIKHGAHLIVPYYVYDEQP